MGKKKKGTSPIDKASPTIRKPKATDVEKVQCTRSTTQGMQASPSWAAATDVQGAVKVWNTCADDIEANAKVIATLKDQLSTAEAKQRSLRRNWQAATSQVLSTVNVFCGGSADMVKTFNVDVRAHTVLGAQAAVEDVTVSTGTQIGEVVASWPRGTGRRGFVVQWATDPANAATYSAQTPCTKTKYTLGGSPSGSIVHLHVAAVDPTSKSGIGPWSAWAAGTAR
jgi:hypothetical protein